MSAVRKPKMDKSGYPSRTLLDEVTIQQYNRNLLFQLRRNDIFPGEHDLAWWRELLLDLIHTFGQVRISNKHRAVCMDAISAIISHGVISFEEWRSFCLSLEVWKQLLSTYFERGSDSSLKPLKVLLDTLMTILYHQRSLYPERFSEASQYAVRLCTDSLFDDSASGIARPSMRVLEHLLRNKYLDREQLISIMTVRKTDASDERLATEAEVFVHQILLWARNADLARVCGSLLGSFCSSEVKESIANGETSEQHVSNCWFQPLRAVLAKYPDTINAMEKFILPDVLKVDKASSVKLSHVLPLHTLWEGNTAKVPSADIRMSLLFLRVNEDLGEGTADDPALGELDTVGNVLTYRERILINLVSHYDAEVRVSALSLLVEPRQTSRPIKPTIILSLSSKISEFFIESDPKMRNEVTAYLRRLFKKLEAMAWRLYKTGRHEMPLLDRAFWYKADGEGQNDTEFALLANVGFLNTCEQLVTKELSPGASFQRHSIALTVLLLLRNLDLPTTFTKQSAALQQKQLPLLLNLTMDPFEDVRSTAAKLAMNYKPDSTLMDKATSNAEYLMRSSGRADHADGFGRLMQVKESWLAQEKYPQSFATIKTSPDDSHRESRSSPEVEDSLLKYLSIVETSVSSAEKDLRHAIADAPLHGYLIALRYLIIANQDKQNPRNADQTLNTDHTSNLDGLRSNEAQRNFTRRISHVCQRIWAFVTPILCDDSPEGLEFFGADDDEALDVGTKDTLSYAWRALKESSLLLQAMLGMADSSRGSGGVDMQLIGNLLFAQLAQLRHRGAFSAVAQTFTSFTIFCMAQPDRNGGETLASIYSKTLDCVLEKGNALTRRSAGLPALIVGLLIGNDDQTFTVQIFQDLKEIAQRPAQGENAVGLPQVHALNCLMQILLNSRLGTRTESQVSDILRIAVDCLDSGIWAIRNSGLMLLKALLLRLEEGRLRSNIMYQNSSRGVFSKTAYAKHPALRELVLDLLSKAAKLEPSAESGEAQARLIEKTFPAMEIIERVGVPLAIREEVKALLVLHLSSSVWAMREKAAGCLALLVDMDEVTENIKTAAKSMTQNRIHGSLLLARHRLRESSSEEDALKFWAATTESFEDVLIACSSPFNEDLFFENLLVCINDHFGQNLAEVETTRKRSTCAQTFLGYENSKNKTILATAVHEGPVVEFKFRFWLSVKSIEGAGYSAFAETLQKGPFATQYALEELQTCARKPNTDDLQALLSAFNQLESIVGSNNSHRIFYLLVKTVSRAFALLISDPDNTTQAATINEIAKLCGRITVQGQDQQTLNETVRFWGVSVATQVQYGQPNKSSLILQQWYMLLRSALAEELDLNVRQAAIDSIENFKAMILDTAVLNDHSKDLLGLALALYDAVVDDDEDIRLQAAKLASWLLYALDPVESGGEQRSHRAYSAFSPPAVQQRLLVLLPRLYARNSELAQAALQRMLGSSLDELLTQSFSIRYEKAVLKSITLFDEERQNQYVHQPLEVDHWAAVLSVTGSSGTDGATFDAVGAWTLHGLSFLRTKLDRDDRERVIGPLGELLQPDAYLLCRRLFGLAGWLLQEKNLVDWNTIDQLEMAYKSLYESAHLRELLSTTL